MKKRILTMVLACTIALSMAGCGKYQLVRVEEEDKQAAEALKTADETSAAFEEAEEESEEIEEEKPEYPVLGDNVEGYDGFAYLYDEVLTTDAELNEEKNTMKKDSVVVYIIQDEYNYVSRSSASSSRAGVSLYVDVNPYMMTYNDDNTIAENLEKLVEEDYSQFNTTEYKDIVISEPEGGIDWARMTVSCIKYLEWDDSYDVLYDTYYYKQLSDSLGVSVNISVSKNDSTGKTQEILDEVSDFYELDIMWEPDEAAKKLENYLSSGVKENTVTTGFMTFNLPEGWKEDEELTDYSTYFYAPSGITVSNDGYIYVSDEYVSDEINIEIFNGNEDLAKEMLQQSEGIENIENVSTESIGNTAIGKTVLIKADWSLSKSKVNINYYLGQKGYYVYTVVGVEIDGSDVGALDAAADIVENAAVKEY